MLKDGGDSLFQLVVLMIGRRTLDKKGPYATVPTSDNGKPVLDNRKPVLDKEKVVFDKDKWYLTIETNIRH